MSRITRALVAGALLSTLAACVVTPPERPGPSPHEIAAQRLHQVDGRIGNLSRRVDAHVADGRYPPPQGDALHHRLDVIRGEAHNMAAQHGGGLSSDEQRVLNEELDTAAHAIE
ncbi:hypothetical protein [Paraburkholderia caballeronis]|uniref:hypothetical protein n=1 Tax=Paraburkholderia caballeronis TaxID=416943 RepID=UPI001066A665|nr:hypothetical protein [Paraburkholderia caballeronis]TDV10996.1 hypothetical protein C7408_1138 [Paraburkholderia caballeronis]TDV14314.1 hypothetical protein C7406_114150 [Paraburkholderia caballeronis]TDV23479.1 hypothetical protein C7404_113150 [Paraburkholderia caballeronis]